jgi:hypothetical protein
MRARCEQPTAAGYGRYGARGIAVCDAWQDFSNFAEWALSHGYDEDLSLERIDNDGPYSPENCCWIALAEQGANKRNNRVITAFGETKHFSAWLRDPRCTVAHHTLHYRLSQGWLPERAISQPPGRQGTRYPRPLTKQ